MRAELLLSLLLALAGCSAGDGGISPDAKACLDKARAYYQRIGAYPKFSDGRDAEQVAAEHCSRSPRAFDGV